MINHRNLFAFAAAMASGLRGLFGPGLEHHPAPRFGHATTGKRTRIKGDPGQPGDKLKRKAAKGMLTKCHGGLAPTTRDRYPFSATKRRPA